MSEDEDELSRLGRAKPFWVRWRLGLAVVGGEAHLLSMSLRFMIRGG
jgi:hypothetical protein